MLCYVYYESFYQIQLGVSFSDAATDEQINTVLFQPIDIPFQCISKFILFKL